MSTTQMHRTAWFAALLICWGCSDDTPETTQTSADAGIDAISDLESDAIIADAAIRDATPDAPADMQTDTQIDQVDMPPDMELPPPVCTPVNNCASLDPGATEHFAKKLEGCAFQLEKVDRVATAHAELDSIAAAAKGYVGLRDLDFNRDVQSGVTAGTADRLKNHDYFGFRWNAGDMATPDWYPQGVTGNDDAGEAGRMLLVTWYDHTESIPEKGVRVSVVNLAANPIQYRHILLVEPNGTTFKPVLTGGGSSLHAGGMVWFGDYLYVADTGNGFRVFDLSKIIEVKNTDDTERIGVSGNRVDAFGYRYIAGQIARYRMTSESCDIRFSFAGLDRFSNPPLIITGEYRADNAGGRLARWPVDATGWLREQSDGTVRAQDAFVGAQTRMQGALTRGDEIYISSSSQAGSLGRLYRSRVGQQSKITAWVYGAEDLYLETSTDRVWTAAEHPGARDVVSIPRLAP